ncbi:MAG: Hsp20/alpha crystallin family protein [Candidatus Pacebacteria bacterium]|nr:Hsp20/alpha crystallin family protein [Candidatus Paceibacterota bacterium]
MSIRDLVPFGREQRGDLTTARREAESPFARLHNEMDRLFDRFYTDFFGDRGMLERQRESGEFMPDIDVTENNKEIRVSAELPGVDEKDIDVELDGDMLSIHGQKREEKETQNEQWTRRACTYGSFLRRIPLGITVDESRITATFNKGILKITLPKLKQAEETGKRIKVTPG